MYRKEELCPNCTQCRELLPEGMEKCSQTNFFIAICWFWHEAFSETEPEKLIAALSSI
jgi:hypothetical protein